MSICRFASLFLCGVLAVLASGCGDHSTQRRRPNVLLIVADDMGYNDLAINNGNTAIHTPALDDLARQGIRFTRHYADAVCSPARAALLTGQYAARNNYEPNGRGMSPQLITLAEALRDNGYQTWHIGKWHIGDTLRDAWPDRQGFEHWFGFLNQWLLAGAHRNGKLIRVQPRYNDPWLITDGDAGQRYPGHLDDILTDKAIATLGALAEGTQPWFINLWYYAPHAPVTPAADFAAQYPSTPAGRYRALVHQLDANVARVLEGLRASGQLESTVVIFVSDNGGTNHEIDSNYPFFGNKATFHEGGLRTPLLIRLPGQERRRAL